MKRIFCILLALSILGTVFAGEITVSFDEALQGSYSEKTIKSEIEKFCKATKYDDDVNVIIAVTKDGISYWPGGFNIVLDYRFKNYEVVLHELSHLITNYSCLPFRPEDCNDNEVVCEALRMVVCDTDLTPAGIPYTQSDEYIYHDSRFETYLQYFRDWKKSDQTLYDYFH